MLHKALAHQWYTTCHQLPWASFGEMLWLSPNHAVPIDVK